jgi:hypothetical protein
MKNKRFFAGMPGFASVFGFVVKSFGYVNGKGCQE